MEIGIPFRQQQRRGEECKYVCNDGSVHKQCASAQSIDGWKQRLLTDQSKHGMEMPIKGSHFNIH